MIYIPLMLPVKPVEVEQVKALRYPYFAQLSHYRVSKGKIYKLAAIGQTFHKRHFPPGRFWEQHK